MLLRYAALAIIMSPVLAFASVPESAISDEIAARFGKLMEEKEWTSFVASKKDLFPPLSDKDPRTSVRVEKEELKIKDETFTLGMGYRETYIKAPIEKVRKILNSPEMFQYLYGLDGDSKVDLTGAEVSAKSTSDQVFKARILKKIPILSDQDYVLKYRNFEDGKIWFQRAELVEDKKQFALRDNLKALEPAEGGVIFREVSMVYVLSAFVRALGPQIRSIMNSELKKITESVKCAAESPGENLTEEVAKACWKKASG